MVARGFPYGWTSFGRADGVGGLELGEKLLIDALTGGAGVSVAGLAPLDALQAAVEAFDFEPPHPLVGWLGFVSYDLARHLENIPAFAPDTLRWPLIRFSLFRHYVLFEGGEARAFSLGPAGGAGGLAGEGVAAGIAIAGFGGGAAGAGGEAAVARGV